MGTLQAMEMAEHGPSLDVSLHWHLTSNHYPPVSPQFIDPAKEAIEKAVEAMLTEDETLWQDEIELPNGNIVTVAQIVEGLHLDAFVQHALAQAFEEEEDDGGE